MRGTDRGSGRLEKPPAVLCDFDDTVAVQNVAELILRRFSDGRWEELRRQSRDHVISFREYQERAFRDIAADREAMRAHVRRHAMLRAGFRELWRYCQPRHIPLAIVTVGLDFYVEAVLEREGLAEVPAYTARTTFTPQGIEYGYPHTWDGCVLWGTCKCSVLESYRAKGHHVIYVGDGVSDFCPASRADLVFARSHLAERCRDAGVPYLEFEDFWPVLDYLQRGEAGV